MTEDTSFVEILRGQGIFAELDDERIRELVDVCDHDVVISGQPIWTPGEVGDACYVLLKGRIEVTSRVQPDGQRTTQFDEVGEVLSLPSLVNAWEHRSAGTAVDRSEVRELTRSTFDELFDDEHPAAFRLVDAIADELVGEMRDANRRLHEVFGHPAETLRMLRRRSRETKRT